MTDVKSDDPYDWPAVYWSLWSYVILYVLVVSIPYLGIFVQNTAPLVTWFANPGQPGTGPVSFAGSFLDVCNRMNIVAQILVVPVIAMMIYGRSSYGGTIVWFTFYALTAVIALLDVAALGSSRSQANGPGQFGNPFNDPAYCCAYPAGGCPNTIPCSNPVTLPNQLGINTNADGLFWTVFVLFLMQLIFIGVWIYLFGFRDKVGQTPSPLPPVPPSSPVTPEKSDTVLIPAVAPVDATVRQRMHGLKRLNRNAE